MAKVRELKMLEIVEIGTNASFAELYMARCGKDRCKSIEDQVQEDQNGQRALVFISKTRAGRKLWN